MFQIPQAALVVGQHFLDALQDGPGPCFKTTQAIGDFPKGHDARAAKGSKRNDRFRAHRSLRQMHWSHPTKTKLAKPCIVLALARAMHYLRGPWAPPMRLTFNSALLAYAASFTGKFGSDQGIEVTPLRAGEPESGVTVAAFNRGAIGMIGYDPDGKADSSALVFPDSALVKAANGIKTAGRDVCIEGDDLTALSARVTTYYKEHNTFKDFTVRASLELPSYRPAIAAALKCWGSTPETSTTAGRYDLSLLLPAIKAMVDDSDSLVLSGYHGGPLRLQREDLQMVVLLMPQTALPIPAAPDWLGQYAHAR